MNTQLPSDPQMIVPKRAALLLDRLMVALHHALEDGDQEGVQRIGDYYKAKAAAEAGPPIPIKPKQQAKQQQKQQQQQQQPSKFVPNFSFDGEY